MLDANFYLVRGGLAWRQLPAEFPPPRPSTGCSAVERAPARGARIHDALRDGARIRAGRHPNPTAAVIDSASVRGADTVPTRSRSYDADKRVNGRMRHLAVDTGGLLLTVVVTTDGIQDRDGAVRLRAALRATFSTIVLIWADGGYAGRLVRWAETALALTVTIVERTDDLTGFQIIPRRRVVERTLAWVSKHRRCVRDYETRPEHAEAMVHLAMIRTMSRRLAR
jgi:transposase